MAAGSVVPPTGTSSRSGSGSPCATSQSHSRSRTDPDSIGPDQQRRRPGRSLGGHGLMGRALALAGQVVLVTGSSRGIGAEVALKAASEGARVAVHYHSSADGAQRTLERARNAGAEAESFAADIRGGRQSQELIGRVIERFRRGGALANNAGRTQVRPFPQIGAA